MIAEEMKKAIKNHMAQYALENPDEIEDVAYIFANAMQMIEQSSPKDIKKEYQALACLLVQRH